MRVSTYQSVSGAGAQRMERLRAEPPEQHDLAMDWTWEGDETEEESKIRAETQKILELPELPLSATTVRVPVLVGHAEAVWIETEEPLSPEQAEAVLADAPGVRLVETPDAGGRGPDGGRARRPHPSRSCRGEQRARPLPRLRQPRQGRRAERDPDRRAPARAGPRPGSTKIDRNLIFR